MTSSILQPRDHSADRNDEHCPICRRAHSLPKGKSGLRKQLDKTIQINA